MNLAMHCRMVEWRHTLLMEMLTASSSVQPSGKLKKNPLLLLDKTQTCLFCSCSISNPNISTCFSLLEIKCGTSKQHTVQGADICTNILFSHAIEGCDTTSSLFSIGKRGLLLQLKNSPLFRQQAEVFATESNTQEAVTAAGNRALVLLYGGKEDDSLNTLRCFKYLQKLSASKSALEPKRLPPTAAAAQFHSLRTYFQVQVWLTLTDEKSVSICPTDWGWEVKESLMFPLYTDAAAAPEDLLHVVKCNCKMDCATSRCSCRRHGLVCAEGGGECRGDSCMNSVNKIEQEPEDVDFSP